MMDVTVCVGTFGTDRWRDLGAQSARQCAATHGVPVVHDHGATLHDARNGALSAVETEWACFLDADDQLEPGYFMAMERADGDVRVPWVRYVRNVRTTTRPIMPRVPGHHHDCIGSCLPYGNWIVIGAVVRTALVREVGGFADYPMYEDWDLWLRCWQAGADVQVARGAVYRAFVRQGSRNREPDQATRIGVHRQIATDRGVPVP